MPRVPKAKTARTAAILPSKAAVGATEPMAGMPRAARVAMGEAGATLGAAQETVGTPDQAAMVVMPPVGKAETGAMGAKVPLRACPVQEDPEGAARAAWAEVRALQERRRRAASRARVLPTAQMAPVLQEAMATTETTAMVAERHVVDWRPYAPGLRRKSRGRATMALFLAWASAVSVGCAARSPSGARGVPAESQGSELHVRESGILTLQDGAIVQGDIAARRIVIPAGAAVTVEGPLRLRASEDILIAGNLLSVDGRGGANALDAPSLDIRCEGRLTILGAIFGGSGYSADVGPPEERVGMPGGHGGSISLAAPEVEIAGVVRAGDGGNGGRSGAGGNGGSVRIAGEWVVGASSTAGTGVWAGTGGRGGDGIALVLDGRSLYDGGESGRTGDVGFSDY